MSVTIPTPDSTRYITVTLHLLTETDVLEQAEEHGVEATYLPREGDAANLVMAHWPEGQASVTVISQVYR